MLNHAFIFIISATIAAVIGFSDKFGSAHDVALMLAGVIVALGFASLITRLAR